MTEPSDLTPEQVQALHPHLAGDWPCVIGIVIDKEGHAYGYARATGTIRKVDLNHTLAEWFLREVLAMDALKNLASSVAITEFTESVLSPTE